MNNFLAITGISSLMVAIFLIYLIPVIASWKIFTKAEIAGWKSIIPVYNLYLLFKISGMSGLWVIPLLVLSIFSSIYQEQSEIPTYALLTILISGLLTMIAEIIKAIKLPKAFGKGFLYTLLLILLPNIGEIALGFGSAKYQGEYKK